MVCGNAAGENRNLDATFLERCWWWRFAWRWWCAVSVKLELYLRFRTNIETAQRSEVYSCINVGWSFNDCVRGNAESAGGAGAVDCDRKVSFGSQTTKHFLNLRRIARGSWSRRHGKNQ